MFHFDEAACLDYFRQMLAIDSTTGQFREIQDWTVRTIREMGYEPQVTHKGGVLADLGGEGEPLVISAHLDDIGLMVRHINADGTLNVCPVGGLYPFYCVTENVRHTAEKYSSCCLRRISVPGISDQLGLGLGTSVTSVLSAAAPPFLGACLAPERHTEEAGRSLGLSGTKPR